MYNTLNCVQELIYYSVYGVLFGILTAVLVDKVLTYENILTYKLTQQQVNIFGIRIKENILHCLFHGFHIVTATHVLFLGAVIGYLLRYLCYINLVSRFYAIIIAGCKNLTHAQMEKKIKYIQIRMTLVYIFIYTIDLLVVFYVTKK